MISLEVVLQHLLFFFLLFSTLKVMANPYKLLVHIRHASVQDVLPSGKGREAG